jgi:SAM-dependent methyltransferase
MLLKDSGGVTVELTNQNTILKTAHDHDQYTKLRNAVRFHKLLGPLGIAPQLLVDNDSSIELEYVEDNADRSDDAKFQDNFRRNAIRLLLKLKQLNVFHTDLTEYNYVVQESRVCPYDWSEARFGWETAPNKRAGMDADWLYPSLLHHMGDHNRIVRKWLAISQHIKPMRGWGRVLDLGCLYGDISAMATSEGFKVTGVDNNAFDEKAIEHAQAMWNPHVQFITEDMYNYGYYKYDIVLMLSSWSHFVANNNFEMGVELLWDILSNCGVLFFENHVFGDGPGNENLKTEEDHLNLFKTFNATAVPITTIPVGGRPFSRTVYKVSKN